MNNSINFPIHHSSTFACFSCLHYSATELLAVDVIGKQLINFNYIIVWSLVYNKVLYFFLFIPNPMKRIDFLMIAL